MQRESQICCKSCTLSWVMWRGHVLTRLQVFVVSWRIRAQGPGSLPVAVAFGPVFLAVAGLAVNLRLVRGHRDAVQPFPAAH